MEPLYYYCEGCEKRYPMSGFEKHDQLECMTESLRNLKETLRHRVIESPKSVDFLKGIAVITSDWIPTGGFYVNKKWWDDQMKMAAGIPKVN